MLRAYKIHEAVESFPDVGGTRHRRDVSCKAASSHGEEGGVSKRQEAK